MQGVYHPISYQLRIVIEKPATISIGRPVTFMFPPGKYICTGSARRNIESGNAIAFT